MTLSNDVYTAEVYFRFPDDITSLVLTGTGAHEFDVKEENIRTPGMTYDETDYAFTLETVLDTEGKLIIQDKSAAYTYTENYDAKIGEINSRETTPGFYIFDTTWTIKGTYTYTNAIGHWAAKQIGIAYANEWIAGSPDGTFKPDQNITRAEAMATINRVLERKPETTSDLLADMNMRTDNMDASKWYYLGIQEATNSHAYTRKTFGGELWRQMLATPDWASYER